MRNDNRGNFQLQLCFTLGEADRKVQIMVARTTLHWRAHLAPATEKEVRLTRWSLAAEFAEFGPKESVYASKREVGEARAIVEESDDALNLLLVCLYRNDARFPDLLEGSAGYSSSDELSPNCLAGCDRREVRLSRTRLEPQSCAI